MTMHADDRIVAPSRGSADAAIAYAQAHGAARPDFTADYIRTVYALCADPGMPDAAVVVAQSAHETANPQPWQSAWFRNRGNVAGIGITGDATQDAASHTWQTGAEAARSHVAHLLLYNFGRIDLGGLTPADDPRYDAYVAAYGPNKSKATTIASLAGTWAADANYAVGVVGWGGLLFPNLPDQSDQTGGTPTVTTTPAPNAPRGHVPRPPMIEDTNAGRNKRVGSGREPDQPRAGHIVGTCHHTSEGYFSGNKSVFDDPTYGALTDFQVGGPWDGSDVDGVVMQFIADGDPIVPWANGTVGTNRPPYGDAPAFLAQFGQSKVNVVLRSIETTDGEQPDRAKGGRQIESLCYLTAWIHAEQAGQTPDTFAWNMHHREFGVDHQACPGAWIINNVDAIQARTKAIMHAYQTNTPLDPPLLVTYPKGWAGDEIAQPGAGTPTGTTTPAPSPYADPIKPPAWDGSDKTANGVTYVAVRRQVTAVKDAHRLQTFDVKGPRVGPDIPKGTDFEVIYKVSTAKGGFFVTSYGTVVSAGNITPLVTIKQRP